VQLLSKAKIKLIRSLRQKKYRDIEDRFVVEGEKLIDDILKFNADLIEFVVTEEG
jgi:TrmH family RNA methyltransferase